MRICLIASVPFPPEEGLGHHVWNLARQLVFKGHQVAIITRGSLAPREKKKLDEIIVWRVPFAPVYPFHVHLHGIFVNRIIREIENEFDLINLHTPLPPPIETRLPLITTVHSPMRADTAATLDKNLRTIALRMQSPISQQIEKAIFRRSQRITAVAAWVAKALQAYGINPDSVVITGNGVEDVFLEKKAKKNIQSTVLYVGRLDIGKGLEDLIEAAKILRHQFHNAEIRFILVGKGPLLNNLRKLVKQADLAQQFEFYGHLGSSRRRELLRLYQQASVFVLPSYHEGMPTVLLEAMATGLSSVSTATGGALELVKDGENGLLVPVGAPAELAQAISRVLQDAKLAALLGEGARSTILRNYSWSSVCQRYVTCYEQVLEERSPLL